MKEVVKPYSKEGSKKTQVETMFDNVAFTYDILNRILSFNIDIYWRNILVDLIKGLKNNKILDIATGTGDLAITIAKKIKTEVTGFDLSQNMLSVADKKVKKENLSKYVSLIHGDAENMPFNENEYDIVTVSFGVRNFENLDKGLTEIYRVLKLNGSLFILEFSQPENFIFKKLYFFYFTKILPFIGGILSKDKYAYSYLPSSVYNFPHGEQMLAILSKNGFKNTSFKKLTFGIASIYIAKK
ncbi:MAG: bifunctional demethylmenaquinone methyltransferase/2-methoxy-6-polyprenyl-1,4-benzoquinol methylase UbiE [Solirubrobacteraceae bacterium]